MRFILGFLAGLTLGYGLAMLLAQAADGELNASAREPSSLNRV
jgi:hypothetical protein